MISSGVQLDPNRTFLAKWPKHLDPALSTPLQKAQYFAWNVFSVIAFPIGALRMTRYAVKWVFSHIFLPGPRCSQADKEWSKQNIFNKFNGSHTFIRTPDGATIDAAFFQGTIPNKVILYLPGNGDSYETSFTHIDTFMRTGASVMMFNPRRLCNQGPSFPENLALEVFSTFQYLVEHRKIDPKNILIYGRSLGGGYGTEGAELIEKEYPSVNIPIVNERSFESLATQVRRFVGKGPIGFCAGKIASIIGWKMDTKSAWDTLRGKKCLIYHKLDGLISWEASLYHAIKKTNKDPNITRIKMIYTKNQELSRENWYHNRHFLPEEQDAILDFIIQALSIPPSIHGVFNRHKSFNWPDHPKRQLVKPVKVV